MLSWLMFVASGIGPYSGQSVHFRNFAPEPKDYAVNRYTFEAAAPLGHPRGAARQAPYMCGDAYTIVDMAVWGWSRLMPVRARAGGAGEAARTCSAISTRSARARRRSARWR